MHESYTQVLCVLFDFRATLLPEIAPTSRLPFVSSPHLLEQYTNQSGTIRFGMLMEHLDALAASIALVDGNFVDKIV